MKTYLKKKKKKHTTHSSMLASGMADPGILSAM